MDDSLEINKKWWDERAPLHLESDFYSVRDVIGGEQRIRDYEVAHVGDVAGKSLLHLQCHLGTESIAWARLGANVTGLDFSEEAIRGARLLAEASGVQIEYVQANVYDARKVIPDKKFDVVYVNTGSLHWLPDIDRWASTAASMLRMGGLLYLHEIHPIANVLDEDSPTFVRDYFNDAALTWNEDGSYADTPEPTKNNEHIIWDRPVSEIFQAVVRAGLVVTLFEERAGQQFKQFHYQEQSVDDLWYPAEGYGVFPSTFSLRAIKARLDTTEQKDVNADS